MGEDTVVIHKVGLVFTVVSEVNGKKGKRECLPCYYNVPGCCSESLCGGALQKTASNAKAIGGAPDVAEMER